MQGIIIPISLLNLAVILKRTTTETELRRLLRPFISRRPLNIISVNNGHQAGKYKVCIINIQSVVKYRIQLTHVQPI